MHFDYLRRIECAVFPLTVADPREIEYVQYLERARYIEAVISKPWKPESSGQRAIAVIRRILPLGRAALEHLNSSASEDDSSTIPDKR